MHFRFEKTPCHHELPVPDFGMTFQCVTTPLGVIGRINRLSAWSFIGCPTVTAPESSNTRTRPSLAGNSLMMDIQLLTGFPY
jgi:hypothetical protein